MRQPSIATPPRGAGPQCATLEPIRPRLRPAYAHDPRTVAVSIPGRTIQVGLARERGEFAQAFRLLAVNYQARGYDLADSQPFRFTPFHVLPDTATFVAKDGGRVVATISLVPDTRLLGLPMESIYAPEVDALRREGRRLGEVTSLADRDLTAREFLPVFLAMIRLMLQYHVRRGGDAWAIAVNPRHGGFYRKVLGAVPLGDRRTYPSVNDHPAEAYWVDRPALLANAPSKSEHFFAEDLPDAAVTTPERPPGHARYFAGRSDLHGQPNVAEVLRTVEHFGSPPRWMEVGDAG